MRDCIRPCDVTDINAKILDCCFPCYFQGSDAEETLAIPIYREMTYRELYEALKDEFHATEGYFSEVCGSGGMAEEALHSMVSCMLPEDTDKPVPMFECAEYQDEPFVGYSMMFYVGLFAEKE